MNLSLKSIEELLDLALNTTNLKEMFFLKNYPSVNVRRALAQNVNIDEETLEHLYNDPVQNVSYMASIHPKSNHNLKTFKDLRPCVVCEKSELELYCTNCEKIEDHKF